MRRAHGVRGAFAVEVLTAAPDVAFTSGAVVYAGDRHGAPSVPAVAMHIEDGRPMNREWLVRTTEVSDRDVAATWRGRYLFVEASVLPAPGEDEVYVFALIGMDVQVEGQGRVGHVRDVFDAPQGLLIEVETEHGHALVPWRPELIAQVDEASRTIVLKPLDGLLD